MYRLVRVAGRGYSDGVRNLEVMVESLSAGSRPEIQEEGRVMELNFFLFKYSRRYYLILSYLIFIHPSTKQN